MNPAVPPPIPKDSPERFKRIYLLLAFSCLAVILIVSIFIINRQNHNNLLEDAALDTEKTAAAFMALEEETLFKTLVAGSGVCPLTPTMIDTLDRRARSFLPPYKIATMVVYDRTRCTIFSTDRSLIGTPALDNPLLTGALQGNRQAVLHKHQDITDLAAQQRHDVEVAEAFVPVRARSGQVIGAIGFTLDMSDVKAEFRENLVVSVASLVIALLILSFVSYGVINRESAELARVYQLLETLAVTDELTGLVNRRHLLTHAENMFTMLQRSPDKIAAGVGLGLVMMDLDHFKEVNDTHGHLVGDEVLRAVSRRFESVIRPYDILGRYGGEEFLLLLPNTAAPEVAVIARRLLEVIRAEPFTVGSLSLWLTVSIGCTWTGAREPGLDRALHQADEMLYEAKRAGRNRVESATVAAEEQLNLAELG
ncbi:MAG TPA: diguanylate cyclase [Geobacteraceae bacterium]